MKHRICRILIVTLAALLTAGCSVFRRDEGIYGLYELVEMREGEAVTAQEDLESLKEYGLYSWLEINETNTAVLHWFGETLQYTLDEKNKVLIAADTQEEIPFVRKRQTITLGEEGSERQFHRVDDPEAYLQEVIPHLPAASWQEQAMKRTGNPDNGYYEIPARWFRVLTEEQEQKGMQIWTDGQYFRLTVFSLKAEERSEWKDQSPEFGLELYAHEIAQKYMEHLTWKNYEQYDFNGYAVKECGMSFDDGSWMVIAVFCDESSVMHYFIFETSGTEAGNWLNAFKEHTLGSFRTAE